MRVIAHPTGVLANPEDLVLRTQLSLAALEVGMAFSQTRTALAHALSYDVTLALGVPHGQACALWLPTAWQLAHDRQRAVHHGTQGCAVRASSTSSWAAEAGRSPCTNTPTLRTIGQSVV